jgi:hypothetical protein
MNQLQLPTPERGKLSFSTGAQAPIDFEIPRHVIAEAIVNAVAHRNYRYNGFIRGNLRNRRNLRIEKQGEFRYNPDNWFRVQPSPRPEKRSV